MRQLDRADFDRIGSDLRIAPDDLEELVRQSRRSADELPEMLKQLGISAERLGQAQALLRRDMSGSARSAITRHNATATSPTAPQPRTTTAIAATARRWSRSIAPTSRRTEAEISAAKLGAGGSLNLTLPHLNHPCSAARTNIKNER